jgi:hypothetical protein
VILLVALIGLAAIAIGVAFAGNTSRVATAALVLGATACLSFGAVLWFGVWQSG